MRHTARWIGSFPAFILFITLFGNVSLLKGQTNTMPPNAVPPNRVPRSQTPAAVPNQDGSLPIRPGAVVNTGANTSNAPIVQTTGRTTQSPPLIPNNIPNTGGPGGPVQAKPPVNQPERPPQVLPNGGQPFPPLTKQEAADLDRLLDLWEKRSGQFKSFETEFKCWKRGGDSLDLNQPIPCTYGMIRYIAPNKGVFEVIGLVVDGRKEPAPPEIHTKFLSTGDKIYEYDYAEKQVNIYTIPPDQQEGIAGGGPMPFVFGAKAADLKKRYYLRINTAPERKEKGEIWLEAYPRTQEDAAEFELIQLIISAKDLTPLGLIKTITKEKELESYRFLTDTMVIKTTEPLIPPDWIRFLRDRDIPKGWTTAVIEPLQAEPNPTPVQPKLASPQLQPQSIRQEVQEDVLYTPPNTPQPGGSRPQF